MAICSRMVPRKASDLFKETTCFAVFFYTRERKYGRSTPTHVVAEGLSLIRDMFIEENRRNHQKRNSPHSRRTVPHHSVEQLDSKGSILKELDMKIAEHMTNPDELENEIFRVVEIQDSISECTRLAKRIIDRSEHPQPQPPNVPLLNVDATPYQPVQTNPTPPTLEEYQEPQVNDSAVTPTGFHAEDTLLEHENTQQPSLTELPHVPFNVTSQSTTCLPKLTLPTFSGNPLMWQTFWDSFSAAVHSNNLLTGVYKFNYRRAQVTDEAAKSIAGFPLTNDNYEHLIALLKERFGQT